MPLIAVALQTTTPAGQRFLADLLGASPHPLAYSSLTAVMRVMGGGGPMLWISRAHDTPGAELTALDTEFTTGLSTCQRREIVTSHAAFGYPAARYNLTQVPLSALSPESEPTPHRVAEVAALARSRNVTTIFFETLVSPKVADTIAHEVGARTAVLDPIEGLQPGATGDYFSIMRTNLTALRTALDCT